MHEQNCLWFHFRAVKCPIWVLLREAIQTRHAFPNRTRAADTNSHADTRKKGLYYYTASTDRQIDLLINMFNRFRSGEHSWNYTDLLKKRIGRKNWSIPINSIPRDSAMTGRWQVEGEKHNRTKFKRQIFQHMCIAWVAWEGWVRQ